MQQLYDVALSVQHVVIGVVARLRLVVVPPHQERMTGFVVDKVQHILERAGGVVRHLFPDDPPVLGHVLMPKPVGHLHAANAGHIVLVGIRVAALRDAAEPAALGPGEVRVVRSVEPVGGIACRGVIDRAADVIHGDPGQQIGPGRVCVGIADAVLPAGDAAKVARGIDGIIDRRSGCGRRGGSGIGVPGLLRKLVQSVKESEDICFSFPGRVGALPGVDFCRKSDLPEFRAKSMLFTSTLILQKTTQR